MRQLLILLASGMLVSFLLLGQMEQIGQKPLSAQEITTRHVRQSMGLGVQYLMNQQKADGSFPADEVLTHPVGVTCIAALALNDLGASETVAPALEKAWQFLRSSTWQELPTHELALLTMALVDAGQPRDQALITQLVAELERRQQPDGSWWNREGNAENGLRISYLAVLALRDAVMAGYSVKPAVWKQVQSYWQISQNPDGSWGTIIDKPLLLQENSQLSLAGRTRQAVGTLSLCRQMLQRSAEAAGKVWDCCAEVPSDPAVVRGTVWLQREISRWKPEQKSQSFLQYHLYALEKTGQQLGVQMSDEQDWYLAGTNTLLLQQNRRAGYWEGNNRILATSYALLFLSKALKPVLAQKWIPVVTTGASLSDSPEQAAMLLTSEKHPQDLVDLTRWLSRQPGWPQSLNCQEIRLDGKPVEQGLSQLLQAPVLYVTSEHALQVSDAEVAMLQGYLQQGGVLIGAPVCQSAAFEQSFRELVARLDPGGGELIPLLRSHPVFWMEYPLEKADCELWGLDSGCRTSIFYIPQDIGCQWSQETVRQQQRMKSTAAPGNTSPESTTVDSVGIPVALQLGTNLIAYATSKQVVNRFEIARPDLRENLPVSTVPRGSFQIAELNSQAGQQQKQAARQGQTAPLLKPSVALQRMAQAAGQSAEITVAVHPVQLPARQNDLFPFPLVYLHGSQSLNFTATEKDHLKQYLDNGGILFCDACCGSQEFDRSFRQLLQELYPEEPLERIPESCDLYTELIGHSLKELDFRSWHYDTAAKKIVSEQKQIPAVLEGIQRNGMYFVFYSRYDLGCALEQVSQVTCEGYTATSAAKIATNILLYSLLQ